MKPDAPGEASSTGTHFSEQLSTAPRFAGWKSSAGRPEWRL